MSAAGFRRSPAVLRCVAIASAGCLFGAAIAVPVSAGTVPTPDDTVSVAAAPDDEVHVEVVVSVDADGAEVVSRSLQPGPAPRPGVATASTVDVVARDDEGQVVRTEAVPAPTLVSDFLDADGNQTGAVIAQATTELVVNLPVGAEVTTLEVAVPDRGTAVVDVTEVPLEMQQSSLPATTIVQGGSTANAVDIVFLGDGYTAGELGKYASDVDAAARHLLTQHPFDRLASRINIHRVDVASAESGADDLCAGVYRNTAFDSGFHSTGTDCRSLYSSSFDKIRDAAAAAPAADTVMVLVNTDVYGGAAFIGGNGFSYTGYQRDEVVAHEFGHSFGLLGDEYDLASGAWPGGESDFPNLTSSAARTTLKWRSWVDPATALPSTGHGIDVPGAYEGGGTYSSGLYRPTSTSKMRTLDEPFGRVNSELLTRRVMAYGPADTTPPTAALAQSGETAEGVLLTLNMGDPDSQVIGYQLSNTGDFSDSAMQPAGVTASSTVEVTWPVAATSSTVWLRVRNGAGTEKTTSAVVATTGRPDLVVTGIQWSPTSPAPGAAVAFRATIENQGTAPTPDGVIHGVAFSVGGKVVTWSDTHTSSLTPGASVTVTANGGPSGVATWGATAGAHTIKAVVDDVNRIPNESDETNNARTTNLTVALAPGFSVADASVVEGNGTKTVLAVVTLPSKLSKSSSVKVATAATGTATTGAATAGVDYVAKAPTTVTFLAGQVRKTVAITIKGDVVIEPNETFGLVLSAPVGAAISDGTGVVTIVDDDTIPVLSVQPVSTVEGNSGTRSARFTLQLDRAFGKTVSVKYKTVNGTATAGTDYTAKALTVVSFSAGQTAKTVTVTIRGDSVKEPDETYTLQLSSPVNVTLAATQITGTIVNDD